jgi:hypothetical protein
MPLQVSRAGEIGAGVEPVVGRAAGSAVALMTP